MTTSREPYEERSKIYGRIVAKTWEDEGFKQRLLADPKAALQAEGLTFPEGAEVHVVETNDRLFYLPLPTKPVTLTEEQLSGIAGGNVAYPTFLGVV